MSQTPSPPSGGLTCVQSSTHWILWSFTQGPRGTPSRAVLAWGQVSHPFPLLLLPWNHPGGQRPARDILSRPQQNWNMGHPTPATAGASAGTARREAAGLGAEEGFLGGAVDSWRHRAAGRRNLLSNQLLVRLFHDHGSSPCSLPKAWKYRKAQRNKEGDAVVRGWVISFLDCHFLAACPWNCT